MGCKTQIFDNMEQATPQEVNRLLRFVSPQRRDSALKYKHLSGQFACLKSYELLHLLMTSNGLIDSNIPLSFVLNEHGKPSIEGMENVHFNISHCKAAIAVALSDKPIGIDVETFRSPTPQLLNYTMNEGEAEAVSHSQHPEQIFAQLWTQKEALFKYYGTGITHSIRQLLAEKPSDIRLTTSINNEKKYALTICESISE